MHIGLGLQFANLDGKVTDAEAYRRELDLAARAEGAGFDSVFVSEHHFSDYQLTSQQMMVLSWVAARTEHIKFGTFVTVLPWHDPVRVAESFVVLDHLSGGRAVLGLGRGLGRVEFEGFRVEMGESRQRFTEYSEAILRRARDRLPRVRRRALPAAARPDPAATARHVQGPDVRVGRLAAVHGADGAARRRDHGHRPEAVGHDRGGARRVPRALPSTSTGSRRPSRSWSWSRGSTATPPRPSGCATCTCSAGPARRSSTTSSTTWGSREIEGYEYYGALANNIAKHGLDQFNGFLADLQVWGTPDQVTEKLLDYVRRCDAGALVVPLSFGGMTSEEARACFDLFAAEVLPELKRHDAGGDLGVKYRETLEVAPTAV